VKQSEAFLNIMDISFFHIRQCKIMAIPTQADYSKKCNARYSIEWKGEAAEVAFQTIQGQGRKRKKN
jgi:predicted HicB family RNase H-like nuclease